MKGEKKKTTEKKTSSFTPLLVVKSSHLLECRFICISLKIAAKRNEQKQQIFLVLQSSYSFVPQIRHCCSLLLKGMCE